MKKKNLIIVISILIVISISVSATLIYLQIDKKNKEKKKNEEEIVTKYETFREKVEDFNTERKIFTNQVLSDLFEENLDNYDKWISEAKNYEEKVKIVDDYSKVLKEKCINKIYDKQDIKNKCDAFVIAYETVFNYYVKDILELNKVLSEITTNSKKEYKEYEIKYEYTDINNDGKFYGKD